MRVGNPQSQLGETMMLAMVLRLRAEQNGGHSQVGTNISKRQVWTKPGGERGSRTPS